MQNEYLNLTAEQIQCLILNRLELIDTRLEHSINIREIEDKQLIDKLDGITKRLELAIQCVNEQTSVMQNNSEAFVKVLKEIADAIQSFRLRMPQA